ncbi:MAG TPA: hypothetical protein ENL34_11690 [Chloroflexi bacterium]|nr:hypothetical protein [Chloroflexota bacterium]
MTDDKPNEGTEDVIATIITDESESGRGMIARNIKFTDHRANHDGPPRTEIATVPTDSMGIVRQALAGGLPPETIEKLMDLAERWEAKEAKKEFNAALSAFQGECPSIHHDKNVNIPKGAKYTHASLGQLGRTVDPLLAAHGLSKTWTPSQSDKGAISITCTVKHAAGHQESATMTAPPDTGPGRNSIQAIKSTTTYLRRATAEMALGIVTGDEDDDGRGGYNDQRDSPQRASSRRYAAEEDPAPASERQPDKPAPSKAEANAARAERIFRGYDRAIRLEDLEQALGKPAADWGADESDKLNAWRALYKEANGEQRKELTARLFEPEPGARG